MYRRVRDCCLTSNELFLSYIMARTSYIWWDEVSFVLDQQAYLDLYSASSLKHQSAGRHVALSGHIILIPNQHVCTYSIKTVSWAETQQIPILQFLVWPDRCSNARSTTPWRLHHQCGLECGGLKLNCLLYTRTQM